MHYLYDATLIPAIFEDVPRVRSVFTLVGERTISDPLGNNMSVAEEVVREGLKLVGVSNKDIEEAVIVEMTRAARRRIHLANSVGVNSIMEVSCPRPVQGANVVEVNDATIHDLLVISPARKRADAAIIARPGYANLIAPADCPVFDIVDPNAYGNVAQGHAGWQGILAGMVRAIVTEMIHRGTKMTNVLVNIHPNATEAFELQGEGLERWLATFGGDFVRVINERSYISMTDAVIAQLEEFGVRRERIQTSSAYSADGQDLNTLTDDRFYSHRMRVQKGVTGRNAAILVRVNN
jgi:copper oxidase (laccase) domain-containing protein